MPPIIVSAEVERSAEAVYAYTTDPSRFGEWQQGVVSGHGTGGPSGEAAVRHGTQDRLY